MPDTVSAMAAAKLEKERALAKLRVLQSDALEGRLLDREQVRAQWAQAFAALRDRALGMADRIASRGAGRNVEELRAVVDSEVRDLLGAVSRGEF
ncbi:MAG TPA: hypothetical protein VKB88_09620 [Bryobacteraceae bacterium]|nr:hypothetical protein [Bryobacteraceae bacterium]